MKIKDGFMLRRFADKWVAVSVDELAETRNTLITLNKTAAFVWERMQEHTDRQALIDALTAHFDVSDAQASTDVDAFLENARKAGILDE